MVLAAYSRWHALWDLLVPDAELVECSVICSEPGAPAQDWHRDSVVGSPAEARLVSMGIALEEVDEQMGPLEALPTTHCLVEEAEKPEELPVLKAACERGGAILWDSRLFHRGGDNRSGGFK